LDAGCLPGVSLYPAESALGDAAKILPVAGLSTNRKLAIAGRVAGRAAANHPFFRAAWAGAQAAGRALVRAFRQLWLEISGVFFLLFAALGGVAAYREYPAVRAGEGSVPRMAVISLFTVTFLWFGLSSLWRARRKT
jgi:hypothetical protein